MGLSVFFFLVISYVYRFKLLPTSILYGILGGSLWYHYLNHHWLKFLGDYNHFGLIAMILAILFLSNLSYIYLIKGQLNYKKSFLLTYLEFVLMLVTFTFLIIKKYPESINFNDSFYEVGFIVLMLGILFSSFIALFFDERIKEKIGLMKPK